MSSPSRSAANATPGTLRMLLARSAGGDVAAFAQFYDATSTCAFELALARARSRGLAAAPARAAAERETARRFVQAWQRAAEQRSSGLTPLPWLLTIPTGVGPTDPDTGREAACA